jgi:hypothetical protein
MEIKSAFNLKEIVKDSIYEIDYGTLKSKSNTLVSIIITGVEHVSVSKSCGCTAPTVEILPDGLILNIQYDSNKMGVINQQVVERVMDKDKKQSTITFKLKGAIV